MRFVVWVLLKTSSFIRTWQELLTWGVFTARYALSAYVRHIGFVIIIIIMFRKDQVWFLFLVSSKWNWSLHLFLGRPMCLRPFGLYCSVCLGILFVSILCMCCSHFSVLLFQVGVSKISSVLLLNVVPLFSSVPRLHFRIYLHLSAHFMVLVALPRSSVCVITTSLCICDVAPLLCIH